MRLVRLARPKAPLTQSPPRPFPAAPGQRRRALAGAAATVAVAALAAGCSGGSGSAASGTTLITVAATQGVDTAPLFIGIKNHTFAQAGLDVKIVSYPNVSAEILALRQGKVDIAVGDYADFLYAQSQRPGLLIVADAYHAASGVMEVLAKPNSGITSPADLVGKKVGTPEPQGIPVQASGTPYSLETLATDSVLQDNDDIDPTKVNWDPMPEQELVNALRTNRVNAILVQEPNIYEAQSQLGAVEVLDSCSGVTANLPLDGYFSSRAYAGANSATLQAFQNAVQTAQADATEPGPVRTVLASDPTMKNSASLITLGSYPTSLDPAGPARVAQLMFLSEVLDSELNVQAMIFH